LEEWRNEGLTSDDVDLWAIGYSPTIGFALEFAGDASPACLADESDPALSAFAAYDAGIDDVFIIDRDGQVRFRFTVALMSMESSGNRDTVDGWVRELL